MECRNNIRYRQEPERDDCNKDTCSDCDNKCENGMEQVNKTKYMDD
jgi:hypothetical protein